MDTIKVTDPPAQGIDTSAVEYFLAVLRHERAAQGHHAPRDCKYFIEPRDKPSERRCPLCDVYMCDKEDMPPDLLAAITVATNTLTEFISCSDKVYMTHLDNYRIRVSSANQRLINENDRLKKDNDRLKKDNDRLVDEKAAAIKDSIAVNGLFEQIRAKCADLEAKVDDLQEKAYRVNVHAEDQIRSAVKRLRIIEAAVDGPDCKIDDKTRAVLASLDFDMMQTALRIYGVLSSRCIEGSGRDDAAPMGGSAPVGSSKLSEEVDCVTKDYFFKRDGWLGRKPTGVFVCESNECPNGCNACQEKKDGKAEDTSRD